MKVYTNERNEIVSLNPVEGLNEVEVPAENLEDEFYGKCPSYILGFKAGYEECGTEEDGTPIIGFVITPYKDMGMLNSLQEQWDSLKSMIEEQQVPSYIVTAVSFAANSFTDEQALQVPLLYPEWNPEGTEYKTGMRIRYAETLYKVLQDHVSQESWTPEDAPSLFAKVLIPDPEVVPEWVQPGADNGYSKGDHVIHNGKEWESLVDSNVWEPGAVGTEGLWKSVGEE